MIGTKSPAKIPSPIVFVKWMKNHRWFWELLLFAGIAIWSTWPLSARLTTTLPLGTERIPTVPLFNLWTIWWNAETASHGYVDFWQAPIFYPSTSSFAFSETQIPTVIVAPLIWWGENVVLAYNLYLLLSLTANGWVGARLLRAVGLRSLPAILGGAMIELLPIVHWQLGVLQLVPLWGILWTCHALLRFGRQPSFRGSLNLGIAFVMSCLLCQHQGLFFSVLLVFCGWCLLGDRFWEWKTWLMMIPGVLLCLMILGPLLFVQLRYLEEHDWNRSPELVESLSAEWEDYAVAPWSQWIPTRQIAPVHRQVHWKLSPGTLKWLLAGVGLLAGLMGNGETRRWTAFCGMGVCLAVLLSMGPKAEWGGVTPYQWLVDDYPGFSHVRNIFRFAIFAQLFVVFLAALGLNAFMSPSFILKCRKVVFWLRTPFVKEAQTVNADASRRVWWSRKWVRMGWGLIVGLAMTLEICPASQDVYEVPALETNRRWIDWLKENTDETSVIACVPFAAGRTVQAHATSTRWMYFGTFHRRRMLNGYSGYFPETYREFKRAMKDFPKQSAISVLKRAGVAYCIVQRDFVSREQIRENNSDSTIQWVFGDDEARIDIYRIFPNP
ncbi:MAG: hypothetical protein Tsb009_04930 [Planctomycetaceae bacterium]